MRQVTTQIQRQGWLLEKAKRDLAETRRNLEAYKWAFSISERDRHDLEQEKQALKDEIRQLKGRGMHGCEETFEQERRTLNDWILRLEVKPFPHISDTRLSVFRVPLHRLFFVGNSDADGCLFRFPIRRS